MMKALLANMCLITFIHIHDNTQEKLQSYMQMLPPSFRLKISQKINKSLNQIFSIKVKILNSIAPVQKCVSDQGHKQIGKG